MDSIDELYQKIVLVPNQRALVEMPKDSTSTRYRESVCDCSEVFPEEQWLIRKSLEARKIEAMLEKPATKALLVLPEELRVPNVQEIKQSFKANYQ